MKGLVRAFFFISTWFRGILNTMAIEANYYIGKKGSPFQFSVGAVLVNQEGEICVHDFRNYHGRNVYTLMRNTLTPGESLELCLEHGLDEEFGAKGKIIRALGSLTGTFTNWEDIPVQKTTFYFQCELLEQDLAKAKPDNLEGVKSVVEWMDPQFLMSEMKEQAKLMPERSDFHEDEILERYLELR